MEKQENKKGQAKGEEKNITSIIIVIILLIIAGITIPALTRDNEDIEQRHLLTETIKKLSKTYTKPGTYKIIAEKPEWQEDVEVQGSQFVWIPIGNVKTASNTEENIQLGRYTFDGETGEPTLVQSADHYLDTVIIGDDKDDGDSAFWEEAEYREGEPNTTAYNLKDFLESAQKHGGYYFARYEASYASGATDSDYKCASKLSITNDKSNMNYITGTLWNYIKQPVAAKVCQNTYYNNIDVKSDLINSYIWDTAIVYIQKAGNDNYANTNGSSNTGIKNITVLKIQFHIKYII